MGAFARIGLFGAVALLGAQASADSAYQGTILLNFTAPASKVLGARFAPSGLPRQPCDDARLGNCCRPPVSSANRGNPPPGYDVNAGRIIFMQQGVLLGELKPPAPGGTYGTIYTTLVDGAVPGATDWEPGDTILVRSSGGVIPPFSVTAATPPPLGGLNPAPPAARGPAVPPMGGSSHVSLAVNRPIVVSWAPAPSAPPGADVEVTVTDFTDDAVLVCRATDRVGHVHVQYISPPDLPFHDGDKGAIVITRIYSTMPQVQPANASIKVVASATISMPVVFITAPNAQNYTNHEGLGFTPDKARTGPNGTGPLFASAPP